MKKINLGLLFGGESTEHDVSINSARSIAENINKRKYRVFLIYITKRGEWKLVNNIDDLENSLANISITPGKSKVICAGKINKTITLDVVFPMLHGILGEDGTIQGLFRLMHLPFVGAGVLGSAVGMDKEVMKRLLREAGLPIGKYLTLYINEEVSFSKVSKQLGLPFFIKPANLGSSIGVSKVKTKDGFEKAVKLAFTYDSKIIAEEFIDGKEVECAIIGNNKLFAWPGPRNLHDILV